SPEGTIRFPKLNECAHFHYEHVELGPITAELCDKRPDSSKVALASANSPDKENEATQWWFYVKVSSNSRSWVIRRNYENFRMLDKQLHRCVYDRKFSVLQELPAGENLPDEATTKQVMILFYCYY
ncbi:rho GTPase-activating protein 32-like, partial [Limulus polyphemus]|uniref:Rho GTPase-activating protein 32-like n=1 Tax=Limulus polyphemus TaxID=6850 RepID=A0ABM1BYH1_LIMPO